MRAARRSATSGLTVPVCGCAERSRGLRSGNGVGVALTRPGRVPAVGGLESGPHTMIILAGRLVVSRRTRAGCGSAWPRTLFRNNNDIIITLH